MRENISKKLREKVLKRDEYTCRYCGCKNPPFHIDHVYPVVKGGETSFGNLVTSCSNCNLKKHSSVGMWPKPIGYFEKEKTRKVNLFLSPVILGVLISVLTMFLVVETDKTWRTIETIVILIGWIPFFVDFAKPMRRKE